MTRRLAASVFVAFALCLSSISARAQTAQPAKPATPAVKPVVQAPVVYANEDIIKLASAGMSEEFILNHIANNAKAKYDTSVDAILKLRANKLSERVITAMIAAKPATSAVQRPATKTAPAVPPPRVTTPAVAATPSPVAHPPAPKAPVIVSKTVMIPSGTEVTFALPEMLSSKKARTGQPVKFEVVDDVVVDGVIAIKKGARGSGVVTKAVSQMLTRRGSLEFSIDAVQTVDGKDIVIKATHTTAAGRGLIRGDEVEISAGSIFKATVVQDQQLTLNGETSARTVQRAATSPATTNTSVTPIASSSPSSSKPRTGNFTIFVSAPQRDGFFDTTKQIEDSIKDIREILAKEKNVPFTITANVALADIVITVVDRGVGSTAYGQRVSFERYYGGTQLESTSMIANTYWVSTVLEVGKYKKEFTGKWTQKDDGWGSSGAWTMCAGYIGRNIISWVKTNTDRINELRSAS